MADTFEFHGGGTIVHTFETAWDLRDYIETEMLGWRGSERLQARLDAWEETDQIFENFDFV